MTATSTPSPIAPSGGRAPVGRHSDHGRGLSAVSEHIFICLHFLRVFLLDLEFWDKFLKFST